eukprot:TCONS_00044178-protein
MRRYGTRTAHPAHEAKIEDLKIVSFFVRCHTFDAKKLTLTPEMKINYVLVKGISLVRRLSLELSQLDLDFLLNPKDKLPPMEKEPTEKQTDKQNVDTFDVQLMKEKLTSLNIKFRKNASKKSLIALLREAEQS